jgi:hypothetical protein
MTDVNAIFQGCQSQDQIEIVLTNGQTLVGAYMTQAGMHFIHARDGGIHGKVHGPFASSDIVSLSVLKDREAVLAERFERTRGEPVPGTVRRTRDGYEARLDTLARAAALATGKRKDQIERQFNDLAEEIELAKTKRNFVLMVARWAKFSNREPTKLDLSGGDMTSAARFMRPRPQDFDPDPKIRRAAVKVPADIMADPRSPPNMLRALRAAGFNARPSIMGETDFFKADLLVDFPGGKEKGRFGLLGGRRKDGQFAWRFMWEGRTSKADDTRRRRALTSDAYKLFKAIVEHGLAHDVQPASEPPGPGY